MYCNIRNLKKYASSICLLLLLFFLFLIYLSDLEFMPTALYCNFFVLFPQGNWGPQPPSPSPSPGQLIRLLEIPTSLVLTFSILVDKRKLQNIKERDLQSYEILRKLFVSLAIWLSRPLQLKYIPITIVQ